MRNNNRSFTNGDVYQMLTDQFAQKHGMGVQDIDSQWDVVKEEMEELIGAVEDGEGSVEEECVDVLYTVHLFGIINGFDLRSSFVEKASYNLAKSTERNEDGKVTDDV